MNRRRYSILCIAVLLFSLFAHAQFGPPEPEPPGPRLPTPTAFPASGTFPTTESVTLLDADREATIHYTLDGSMPNSKSPVYDPLQVLFVGGVYDGDHGLKTGYTIRARAYKEGHASSETATFQYTVDRRDRTVYISEEIAPSVRMIRDSDNDKMFLVRGTKYCALIDTGLGRGELRDYVKQFTNGLPVKVVLTHSHFDHIGQAHKFIDKSEEYIGPADRSSTVVQMKREGATEEQLNRNLKDAYDGEKIDLGDRSLIIYFAPGHTPGSIVILDPATGNLFSGDSFGSNSPTIPDALFMQGSTLPIDVYYAVVRSVQTKLAGRARLLFSGHNDHPVSAPVYLSNLETALQRLLDDGQAALVPSYRPAGLSQVVVGDRMKDPNWVAINVNTQHFLPAQPAKISDLVEIGLKGANLTTMFDPRVKAVSAIAEKSTVSVSPVAASTRASVTVNGKPVKEKSYLDVSVTTPVSIVVRSPDGTETSTYTLSFQPESSTKGR